MVLVTFLIITISIFLISHILPSSRDLNNYDENYNEAKNITMKEINSNTTLTQKMDIITFNCENTNMSRDWIAQCKNDLSKEFIGE